MDSTLALAGFYFTIISFIGGLFFTRLDSWYGSVREFAGRVALIQEISDFKKARAELGGLRASAPVGSFMAVGGLTTVLLLLALMVPISGIALDPTLFIRLPLLITVLAYWAGGYWLLKAGQGLLGMASQRIEQVFS